MPELKHYRPTPSPPSGFWALLGIPNQGAELLEQVRNGFAFDALGRLAELSGFSVRELADMAGMSRYALSNSRKAGRLSKQKSDRLFQIASVIDAAGDLFSGDMVLAKQWLTTPQRGLGGYQPIEMLDTVVECEAVLRLIGQLEHGVFP